MSRRTGHPPPPGAPPLSRAGREQIPNRLACSNPGMDAACWGLPLTSCSGRGGGWQVGLCGVRQADSLTRNQAAPWNKRRSGPRVQLLDFSWGWARVGGGWGGEGCGLEHAVLEGGSVFLDAHIWRPHTSHVRSRASGFPGWLPMAQAQDAALGSGCALLTSARRPPPHHLRPHTHPPGPTPPPWLDWTPGRAHGERTRAQPGHCSGQS